MKQVTVFGLFCLLPILITQNGYSEKEPPSADNETTNEISSESHQPEQGKVITNSIGMKLVYIPAGSFMMGSSNPLAQLAKAYSGAEEDYANEFPQHQVHITPLMSRPPLLTTSNILYCFVSDFITRHIFMRSTPRFVSKVGQGRKKTSCSLDSS